MHASVRAALPSASTHTHVHTHGTHKEGERRAGLQQAVGGLRELEENGGLREENGVLQAQVNQLENSSSALVDENARLRAALACYESSK